MNLLCHPRITRMARMGNPKTGFVFIRVIRGQESYDRQAQID